MTAATAGNQYADLLPLRERIIGPDHPDTLAPFGMSPHAVRAPVWDSS
jgi:hypothetical protein